MPARSRTSVNFSDFSGGLNEDDNPTQLQQNELRLANNVYREGRAVAARPGTLSYQSAVINSGFAVNGIYELVRNQGANRDIMGRVGAKIYSGMTANPPTDITGAVTIAATGHNNQDCYATFNDIGIGCNGSDSPWQWTGAGNATALGGTPPAFGTLLAKWNRLFGAGHAAAARTIRYTAIGDPANWPAANTVAAILGDASSAVEGRDFIYQLGHLGDSIFVGLKESMGRVLYTGDSTTPFRYTQLSEFGVAGRFSYVAVGYGGYFLSSRGVHFIRPSDVLITYESSLISGGRLRKSFRDNLNLTRLQYGFGLLYQTKRGNLLVLWALTSTGAVDNDVMLAMDVTDGPGHETFFWWSGMSANVLAKALNASTFIETLLGGQNATLGKVWQGDYLVSYTDDGTAYVAEAASRWEDFGAPGMRKSLRKTYFEGKATGAVLNIDTHFDYNTNFATTSTVSLLGSGQAIWGTAIWGTDVWATLGVIRTGILGTGSGQVISWRFYTTTASPWSAFKLVPSVQTIGEATT